MCTSLSAFGAFAYGIADNLSAASSFGLPDPFCSALQEAASGRSLSSRYNRDVLAKASMRSDPSFSSSRIDRLSSRLPTAADMQRYNPQRTPPVPEIDPADEISVRMFDLVIPRFKDEPNEGLFTMLGHAHRPPTPIYPSTCMPISHPSLRLIMYTSCYSSLALLC